MGSRSSEKVSEDLLQAPLAEWHKPEVTRITVSLDTALGGSSGGDLEAGEFFPSDMRLKQDIATLDNAMGRLLATNYAAPRAHLIPLLAEAIKEQQGMIEDLQAQVAELRR